MIVRCSLSNRILELFSGRGRVAAVTAGTGALCGQMAQVLGESGYKVVVAGRDAKKGDERVRSIMDAGGEATFVRVDVTDHESITGLVEQTVETYGALDVLVNGAGKNQGQPSMMSFAPDDFNAIMDTNARSTWWATQAAARHMVRQGKGGNVINVSSVSTPVPLTKVGPYGASKAAVDHITKFAATDLAQHGIRVNAIRPGFFPAEQNRAVLDEVRRESIARQTPLKRDVSAECSGFGAEQDLDAVTLLLASDIATVHMTGEIVTVDAGFSAFTM